MRARNHPDRIQVAFDDHRLVNNAGLILPATLALHLGLPQLVQKHLDLGDAPGRANTGDKLLTLVVSALVGGDCIDDADALRSGSTGRVPWGAWSRRRPPWGPSCAASGGATSASWTGSAGNCWPGPAGAGPGDAPLTIDLDSTICETSPLTHVVTRRSARREVRTWCIPRRRTLVPVGSPVVPPAASLSATPAADTVVRSIPHQHPRTPVHTAAWNR